ncbi:pecanex-like protein 1 [Anthonomus grandis grandis]|uniref:pecanex-like protein 1 n=1 Tax=Anthonomus grandis grandis TaxID=2921223 RepID=UPI0021661080|nr:pecanex-like protein 1 [Anthonomus grandis grandis]
MTSRLAQMQARFQQKQIQEKEEKLLKLYENQQQRAIERVGRSSAGSITTTSTVGATKPRLSLDDRRQKAGVDKSYPLQPLKTNTRVNKTVASSRTTTVVKSSAKKTVSQVNNNKPVVSQTGSYKKVTNNNYKNGNYEEEAQVIDGYDTVDNGRDHLTDLLNDNDAGLDDEELPKIGFNDDHSEIISNKPIQKNPGKKPIEPKSTPNGPPNQRNGISRTEAKVPPTKPAPQRSSSSVSSASSHSSRNSPPRTNDNMSSKQVRAPSNNRPSSKQLTPKSPVVRDDLAECRFCGRRFASDRLGVHEDICGKTGKKKRKTYDATKHRVLGTELESYVLKPGSKKAGTSSKASAKLSAPKSTWRKTHEEFIAAIRAAKQAQAYVAKGGKLTDLPPPPPSTNPDYVQCPHCGRRFNESAAQRHIPKCATYEFNKPKGGQAKGRPGKR